MRQRLGIRWCGICSGPSSRTIGKHSPFGARMRTMSDMKKCQKCGAPNPKQRSTCYHCNAPLPQDPPIQVQPTAPPQQKMRKVVETRCTCLTCGHVWHYGAQENLENVSNALQNLGNACTFPCCCLTSFMPHRRVTDLKKCPKCGSKATESERVEHNIPC